MPTLLASSVSLWIIVLLVGIAALTFLLGSISLYSALRSPVRQRLDDLTAGGTGTNSRAPLDKLAGMLGPLGRILLPGAGKERGRIDRMLYLAGYRTESAATAFFGVKGFLALLLPALCYWASRYLPTLTSNHVLIGCAAAMFMGMVLPNSWLTRKVAARQRLLRNGFPDALDLLVICVESGLGLAAAIERVSDELRFSHPELARELALVNVEMRAGVDREKALRSLSERTGLVDIRGLVSLLIQTLRFGTSVADTLRVFAEEFRDQRTQGAEEQAAKIGTKLIFPLIVCEFPAFFVITIGPVIVRIMEMYGKP
ncbi:MAG: type II secretion system F family protein [Steroidobacteraceae bacterium]